MTIFYADLSHYSYDRHGGVPDFAALKASGISAVCIRATYGDPVTYNPTTRQFRAMANAAKAVGLFVGGYHNLVHGDDASIARQVAYFKAELDAVQADWAMLDVEPYNALVTNGLWPRLDDAARFEAAWTKVDPQRVLAIYLARWFWQRPATQAGLGAAPLTLLQGPLVSSNYPATTETSPVATYTAAGGDAGPGWTPYGGKTPEIWQFSSKANLPGVSSTEDVNAYRGTLDQFKARMRKEVPPVTDWYLNRALTNFRKTVNARFPNRDKASDGTKGDPAHAARTSDHNPDADGSVDAWDMDVELNGVGQPYAADLQRVIAAALKHESIQYVIYNRRITSRSWGLGTWRPYDGPNPHDRHTHFSTRDSHENSTAPWIIEEEDLVTTQAEFNNFMNNALSDDRIAFKLRAVGWQYVGGGIPEGYSTLRVLNTILATVLSLAGKDAVDEAALASALAAQLDGLSAEELAAIASAAREGAATSTEAIVAGVVDRLPGGRLTKADVADAIRSELSNGLVVKPMTPAA